MKNKLSTLVILFTALFSWSCSNNSKNSIANEVRTLDSGSSYIPKKYVEFSHPEWSKNATIYEVNLRQFTREGNFKSFESHLPRLKQMGIDIIWFMPIHPIGELKRKGKMGSYYSVKDYYAVNPEFGTKEEFKTLVAKIHGMGMHVIIDWVGNHSAWDNALAKEHPDWYTKSLDGNFQPTPWYDWDDVIDFDYNNPEMRKYMTKALCYWVKECDIDGYRCDVAGFIPVDFWDNARKELDAIKPVFMLAEWESRDLLKHAFDATYAWTLWDKLIEATTAKKGIAGLTAYMAHDYNAYPPDAFRMCFTDNHDKNSWEGNQYSNFGDGLQACMVFCCVANGMPLVYSGQEAGLNRSLAFFEKDSINWKPHPFYEMYKKLFALKHSNDALWNGNWGAPMVKINNDKPKQIISFLREKQGKAVLPIINFSNEKMLVKLDSKHCMGDYTELFSNKVFHLKGEDEFTVDKWGYLVLVKN